MRIKRLFPFILLNILVSAATTLLILNWFGGQIGAALPAANLTAASIPTAAAAVLNPTQPAIPTQAALPPSTGDPKLIEIQEVIGAGDLNNEVIQIRRLGEGDLRLTGWKLEDNAGHHFTFPELQLNKGGAVRVYTRTGTNTVIELYWGLTEAIWAPGKTVVLYDTTGSVRASLAIK